MGQIPLDLTEGWDRQQRADYKQEDKYTVVKLPCCGTSVEVEKAEDQYITCPNRFCGKRHLLTWGMDPKLRSELDTTL